MELTSINMKSVLTFAIAQTVFWAIFWELFVDEKWPEISIQVIHLIEIWSFSISLFFLIRVSLPI